MAWGAARGEGGVRGACAIPWHRAPTQYDVCARVHMLRTGADASGPHMHACMQAFRAQHGACSNIKDAQVRA